jgi:hypothetical protein
MAGDAGLSRLRDSSERPKEENGEWDDEPW